MTCDVKSDKKPREIVAITQAEIDELLRVAKTTFPAALYTRLEHLLRKFAEVMVSLQNARTSIQRLQTMLFGGGTEHKHHVLAKIAAAEAAGAAPDAAAPDAAAPGTATPMAPPDQGAGQPVKPKKPRKGHGRLGARAYPAAAVVTLDDLALRPGDRCPQCEAGKVYDSTPRTLVKVTGQPPLLATVYHQRRLRCRLCDTMYDAALPAALAGQPKYDAALS